MNIGILALQGGYEAHGQVLTQLGCSWHYVRNVSELHASDALILPGGESSAALKLLHESGLFQAIKEAGLQGMPMFGTCAGAILLAKYVLSPVQASLELANVTVQRNSYGRQLASQVVYGNCVLSDKPLEMVFIRAPRFSTLSSEIKIIATYGDEVVSVQDRQFLLATFHPELTSDRSIHRYFLNMVAQAVKVSAVNSEREPALR